MLHKLKGRRKVSRKELERVGGLLAHCSKVIKGGHTFTRRIYDLMSTVKEPHYKVCLSVGVRLDIKWWLSFARTFNGVGKFIRTHSVYSDASNWGFSAIKIG